MSTAIADENAERLHNELALLKAMYPVEISFDSKSREMSFSPEGGRLVLRIPSGYPSTDKPVVILATFLRSDVRDAVSKLIGDYATREESLDTVCLAFLELLEQRKCEEKTDDSASTSGAPAAQNSPPTTVIIWLHHLLSTTKRKAILSPPGTAVSGISKPGYPGVLIFSGPASDVNNHVRELRDMNWQAFQVRAELDEQWRFRHGNGMTEVENMGDVVDGILEEDGRTSGQERKEAFLQAMKMK